MSEKITAMIEEIKGLTVLELSELVHALEEEFGVSAAAMAAPAAGAAAPAAEEKTEFDVVRFRRRSEDQGHQGRPRGHGSGSGRGQGCRRGRPHHHEGGSVQGGRRGSEEAGRGSRRQGRAEVSFTQMKKCCKRCACSIFLRFLWILADKKPRNFSACETRRGLI